MVTAPNMALLTSWPLVPASSAPCGQTHPAPLPVRWLGSKRRLALVSARLAGTSREAGLLPARVCLGSSVGDVDGDTLYYVVLSAQRLGNFRVQESYEGEGAERLGDEDIRHLSELAEVVLSRQISSVSTDDKSVP